MKAEPNGEVSIILTAVGRRQRKTPSRLKPYSLFKKRESSHALRDAIRRCCQSPTQKKENRVSDSLRGPSRA